ncbi:MAG: NAD/NADP octopine/nopaline dehydrogenase family protein [Anaerolineae bacterium]
MVEQIAVLGGGNIGYATTADLTYKGYEVRLYVRTTSHHLELIREGKITLRISKYHPRRAPMEVDVEPHLVSGDMAEVVPGADLVLVTIPATGQDELIAGLMPLLEDGQAVVFTPGNLGAYVLAHRLWESGLDTNVSIAETSSPPYVARRSGPREVTINLDAVHMPIGGFPGKDSRALAVLQEVYPESAEAAEDALAAALNNSNPAINATPTILNAGAIECGEFPNFHIHRHGVSRSVYRVVMSVDAERVAIREELGYGPPHFTQDELYKHSGGPTGDHFYGREAFDAIFEASTFKGDPPSLEFRYIPEDCGIGAVLFASLGDYLGIETPTLDAVIRLGAVLMGRDYRTEGRTLRQLRLDGLSREKFERLFTEGFS